MNFANFREHAVPLFVASGILRVNFLYFYNVACNMHHIINERAPINMSSFFTTISESRNYNTRSAVRGNLYQTKSRLHITQKSFANAGVKVWNALSISLRSSNKHSFTSSCKIILINTMMACDDYVDFAKILQTVPGIKCN
jgi:hypothetical protein